MEKLNKAKERFSFRNVWMLDGKVCYLVEVAQNLKYLEIDQKWLVCVMEKI